MSTLILSADICLSQLCYSLYVIKEMAVITPSHHGFSEVSVSGLDLVEKKKRGPVQDSNPGVVSVPIYHFITRIEHSHLNAVLLTLNVYLINLIVLVLYIFVSNSNIFFYNLFNFFIYFMCKYI